jgi:hypothetical protein
MRIRFYSEDLTQYVTIRPEEFKLCVKKTRQKKVKKMPVPKRQNGFAKNSTEALQTQSTGDKASLLEALISDIEQTLTAQGKEARINFKLGYRAGYQLSIGIGKEWSNVSRETVFDCIVAYLEGDFD